MKNVVEKVGPDSFLVEDHFYQKAQNSQLHPTVNYFFNLTHKRLIDRYLHLHPKVDKKWLENILQYECKHFFWGGADLFFTATEGGNKRMVVLETNSCPSGQKSMPMKDDTDESRGYRHLIKNSFLPQLKKKRLPVGEIAVIYDKNYMEVSGYAATIAELTGENVYLVPCFRNNNQTLFRDGVLYIIFDGKEIPIRAAFRYVTQSPWSRIPPQTKSFIYNSTLCCLAGGRNKLVANKAYELLNAEIPSGGIKINIPETIKDVSKVEVPLWIKKFGGNAVIKNPYSNAGQGVFTVTSEKELNDFMDMDHYYDQFIVQNLIGHYAWSSSGPHGRYFNIGTLPNKKGEIFVTDLRIMAGNSPKGFFPCAIYARRAKSPMTEKLPKNSWDVLGTNLSKKLDDDKWDSDTNRLLLMDHKDFNQLGFALDDLVEGYIQTILSIVAVDKMAQTLVKKGGGFKMKLFKSLDRDETLINEIKVH